MKKFFVVFSLMVFIFALVLTGCGPKKASEKTLTELDEIRSAADAAEMEAEDCAANVADLKNKIADLEEEIANLKEEIQKYK